MINNDTRSTLVASEVEIEVESATHLPPPSLPLKNKASKLSTG